MESIFERLLISSVQAGVLILCVLGIRALAKSWPKKYVCILWCLVGLRLLLPFSIESKWSLMPNAETIAEVLTESDTSSMTTGTDYVEQPAMQETGDVVQVWTVVKGGASEPTKVETFSEAEKTTVDAEISRIDSKKMVMFLWLCGSGILLGHCLFSYLNTWRRVADAVRQEGNIYLNDKIDTPFVLGYIRPRIYIPFYVSEDRRGYIIAHEKEHLRRLDHVTKLLGYLLLAVYWFQPLVWIAYVLFCKDVEMACDEGVISHYEENDRKNYSKTLLLCSVDKHHLLANPLAFGEIDVKKRIVNVLSFKKPAMIVGVISILVVVVVAGLFLTTRENASLDKGETSEESLGEGQEVTIEELRGKLTVAQREAIAQMDKLSSVEPMPYAITDLGEAILLVATAGTYTDSAYAQEPVSSFVSYILPDGSTGNFQSAGTAYPILTDGKHLYAEEGHAINVLSYENGEYKVARYEESEEAYADFMEKKAGAVAVTFEENDIFPLKYSPEDYEVIQWNVLNFNLDREKVGDAFTTFWEKAHEWPGIDISKEEARAYTHINIYPAEENSIYYAVWKDKWAEETYMVRISDNDGDGEWEIEELQHWMTYMQEPEYLLQAVEVSGGIAELRSLSEGNEGASQLVVRNDKELTVLASYFGAQYKGDNNIKLSSIADFLGHEAFYVYDTGTVSDALITYYANVDGRYQAICYTHGANPEVSVFIKDLDGDGVNEWISNTFYSSGVYSVVVYRSREGVLEEAEVYDTYPANIGMEVPGEVGRNRYYDAETGELVFEVWNEETMVYDQYRAPLMMDKLDFTQFWRDSSRLEVDL